MTIRGCRIIYLLILLALKSNLGHLQETTQMLGNNDCPLGFPSHLILGLTLTE